MEFEDTPYKTAEQQREQHRQLEANRLAKQSGDPLPYPNLWDFLDPTKVDEGASPEEITASYREFRKICPPNRPKEFTI